MIPHKKKLLTLFDALIGIDGAGAFQGRPALGQNQVLDRYRHAIEQALGLALAPALLGSPRLGQGAVRIDQAEAVQIRVMGLDAAEHGFGHGYRRQALVAISLQQLVGAQAANIVGHLFLSAPGSNETMRQQVLGGDAVFVQITGKNLRRSPGRRVDGSG